METIDHVGVAVADLAAARRTWDLLLAQEPELEEVPAQRVPDPLHGGGVLRHGVERGVEGRGPGLHRLVEEPLLRLGERVQRPLPDAHGGGEVAHRRPVEPALGEEPGGRADELLAPRAHLYDATER